MYSKILYLFLIFFPLLVEAQNLPIGTWQAHVPLKNAIDITQSNTAIYCANEFGIHSVTLADNFIETYTKTKGLSEVEPLKIHYNNSQQLLIIVYKNANIDIIKNGKIINLPYIKNATVITDKTINAITSNTNFGYIATNFGIVVIDLLKLEIKETYFFTNGINNLICNDIFVDDNSIIAATENGVFSTNLNNSQIINFNTWNLISDGNTNGAISAITKYNNTIFIAKNNTIYQYNNNNWTAIFSEANWQTADLNNANNKLLIIQHNIIGGNRLYSRVGVWNGTTFDFLAINQIQFPYATTTDLNNNIWVADLYSGLIKCTPNASIINPNGPYYTSNKDMTIIDGSLFVASSNAGNAANPTYNKNGIYIYKNNYWENFNPYTHQIFDTIYDLTVVEPLTTEQKVFLGGNQPGGGIIAWNYSNNTPEVIAVNRPTTNERFRITGSTKDENNNIWFCDAYSNSPIICRANDGTLKYFQHPYVNNLLLKDIEVDDLGQLWIGKESASSGGLVVFNHKNTLDDLSDDIWVNYAASETQGNLPVNDVICIAKDNEGELWLGTSQGIAVLRCPADATNFSCPAEQICIGRNDNSGLCDPLLYDQTINCITVDAANRKWIGTFNGIYLTSATGEQQLHYFNESNSPLLANNIRSIAINTLTGDVFIGTQRGINSYRSTATQTDNNSGDVYVYPNPVMSDYSGWIAIKNIPNNTDVKITDAVGNLVYQTTALGGQAIWDGTLTNGNRAASGVYLVLCKGKDKKEKVATKFVLMH